MPSECEIFSICVTERKKRNQKISQQGVKWCQIHFILMLRQYIKTVWMKLKSENKWHYILHVDVFKIIGIRAEDTVGRIILVFSQKSFRYYDCLQKTLFLSYSNMEKSAITSSLAVETCSWRNASGREACQWFISLGGQIREGQKHTFCLFVL